MAGELLASLEDINTHLPEDKAEMLDADQSIFQIDVSRYIKGLLSGVFTPVVLFGWDSPAHTPEIIRGIAGRLIAAKWYAKLYSEDATSVPEYAQLLYNEARDMLMGVRNGELAVLDANSVVIAVTGLRLSSDDFWPNDTTGEPKFSMGKVWA